jgi:hypothetical protein
VAISSKGGGCVTLFHEPASAKLRDTHSFSREHPIAESALLWVSVIMVVFVLAVATVMVVVTIPCMDLPADFARRE